MNAPSLSVLIPAAGASRRLGQPKQLLMYRGETLIQRSLRLAATLGPSEILVTTGANREAVAAAIGDAVAAASAPVAALEVFNPDWDSGLGGSIARGAAALRDDTQGVLVMLCDQWRIRRPDLEMLMRAWRSDENRIVCAEASGRLRPPVIFPAACFADLKRLQGEHGARAVLSAHSDLVCPVATPAAAFDLDTPADLLAMRSAETRGR